MQLPTAPNPLMENTMNRYIATVIAAACAAAGTAFADDITMDPHRFMSSLSRSQVLQELRDYKAAGVNILATDYNPYKHTVSERSRAEVTAEFMASRSSVAAFSAEDSGSAYLSRMAAIRTRPVSTDLARAE